MEQEEINKRIERITRELNEEYPNKNTYDLSGSGLHFVCEIEPTSEHAEFDRAIEVIILSKPHKHLKTTQYYTVLKGDLELHIDDEVIDLKQGDKYTIQPGYIHWAKSENESWVEIYSTPGWTIEDHIII